MGCSFAALALCFSWSNLYLDAGLSYQDRSVPYHYWRDVSPSPSTTGAVETAYLSTIGDENESPYARYGIGFKLPFRSMDVSAGVFHENSITSSRYRGVTGITLRAQWFPFR